MGNTAIDYEKKERLEKARLGEADLGAKLHANSHAGSMLPGGFARFAPKPNNKLSDLAAAHPRRAGLGKQLHANNYPGAAALDGASRLSQTQQENLRHANNHPRLAQNYRQGERKEHEESENELQNNPHLAEDGGEQQRKDRLENARISRDNVMKQAKKIKEMGELATPMGAFSLLKQVNMIGDMPFVAAMGAALLKDLLDAVFNMFLIGGLFSVLCSIFIFMMIFLAGAGQKGKAAKGLMKKGLALIAGGVADAIPAIGFLPIESLTVAIIYGMTLAERKSTVSQESSEE